MASRVATEFLFPIERVNDDTFAVDTKSLWIPVGSRGVFGGQIIGLALRAALEIRTASFATRNDAVFLHSFHIQFLRPLRGKENLEIKVHITQAGASLSRRFVIAKQGSQHVLTMMVSLCSRFDISPTPIIYQPVGPGGSMANAAIRVHSQLITNEVNPSAYYAARFPRCATPLAVGDGGGMNGTIDIVAVGMEPVNENEPHRWRRANWMRVRYTAGAESKANTDNQHNANNIDNSSYTCGLQACLLGFISDARLLPTGVLGHTAGRSTLQLGMITSLDHSMWIHDPASLCLDDNRWLLYETWGETATGTRVLVSGRFWQLAADCATWKLLASVKQEGMIRSLQEGTEATAKF